MEDHHISCGCEYCRQQPRCGMTGKIIPPEDMGGCNNAEGCDNCEHNETLEQAVSNLRECVVEYIKGRQNGQI